MDISLAPNLENILKSQVSKGIFSSIDEAVTFALQFTFVDKFINDNLEILDENIQKGIDDYKAGEYMNGESAFNKILAKYE